MPPHARRRWRARWRPLAVQAAAEFRHLLAGAGADVLGHGAHPRVAHSRDEIAPGNELAAPRLYGVAADDLGALSELRGNLGGGQVDQQGGRERSMIAT